MPTVSEPTFPHLSWAVAPKGVLVVRVTSDKFELEQAQSLSELVFETPAGSPKRVLVNMAGVKYISSTGVSLLVRLGTERVLRIVNLNPAVSRVMDSIGILTLLQVHRSEREAMDAFGQ